MGKLMRSKWQKPSHLSLTNNALFLNTNVICVMQVMWAIHDDTYFRALMNTSILSLLNTWGTYTIEGTKISVTNLQSLKRMPSEAGLFNLWNALHQKQKNQHLTLNLTQLKQNFLWYSALRSSLVHFTISWTHLDFFSLNLRMMAWSCQSKRYSFISLLFVLKCLLWKKKKKPFVNQLLQPASNFFAKMV